MGWLKRVFGTPDAQTRQTGAPPPTVSAAEWKARGNAALQQWNLAEAARCYELGAQADPADAAARLNWGFVALEQGDFAKAAEKLEQALALRRPDEDIAHDAHYLLARANAGRKQWESAIRSCDAALRVKPDFAEARDLYREASIAWFGELFGARRFAEALAEAERLMAFSGPSPVALGNRAAAKGRLERPQDALADVEEALRMEPDNRGLVVTRVGLLHMLGRIDESTERAREALKRFPDDADLHWNLAGNLLIRGNYEEGWPEYEWRGGRIAGLRQPRWHGEDLEGRTILLYGEQGYGDIIQFVRFVPEVARRAQTVFLRMLRPLEPLQLDLPSNCAVVRVGAEIPSTDYECPLMSLPAVLRTTEATMSTPVPYIRANAQAVQAWKKRLSSDRLNVGITWSGNPNNLGDLRRSVSLAALLGARAAGCRFVAIQTEFRDADRETLAAHPEVLDLSGELHSFADTAAVMQALDLVLTVETSVAHLAGAMGRPLWVMLPWMPDWRWMLEREDSPWYPTARLYRQPHAGDWDSVLARVRGDLAAYSRSPDRPD